MAFAAVSPPSVNCDNFLNLAEPLHSQTTSALTVTPAGSSEDRSMFNNQYEELRTLGTGAFSRVLLCRSTTTTTEAAASSSSSSTAGSASLTALKVMSKRSLKRKREWRRAPGTGAMKAVSALDKVRREVALMRVLNHARLIAMREVIDDAEEDYLILVLEYAVGGQLMDWSPRRRRYACKSKSLAAALAAARPPSRGHGPGGPGTFPEIVAKRVLADVADGLVYLHRHGVVHRDLKPENLLLCRVDDAVAAGSERWACKIGDFGVANRFEGDERAWAPLRSTQGTYHFLAPECCESAEVRASRAAAAEEVTAEGNGDGDGNGNDVEQAEQRAKEQEQRTRPSGYPVDVWALGIVLHAMVYGTVPFDSPSGNDMELFEMIADRSAPVLLPDQDGAALRLRSTSQQAAAAPTSLGLDLEHEGSSDGDGDGDEPRGGVLRVHCDASDPLRELLHGMLEKDPARRLTAAQISSHAWTQHHHTPEYGAQDDDAAFRALTTATSMQQRVAEEEGAVEEVEDEVRRETSDTRVKAQSSCRCTMS